MDAEIAREAISETNPPKYKVQDLVACNQGPGHIIGMQPAKTFRTTPQSFEAWDRRFPGFFDEYVYIVLFDTPQKSTTFEEFVDCNSHIKEERLQEMYDEMLPVACVVCPEQEIQLEWES